MFNFLLFGEKWFIHIHIHSLFANSSNSIQQNFKNRYKCHLCRRVFNSKFVLANHLKVTHEPWIKLDLQSQIDTLGFQRKRK